jgi:hypothetical protein
MGVKIETSMLDSQLRGFIVDNKVFMLIVNLHRREITTCPESLTI